MQVVKNKLENIYKILIGEIHKCDLGDTSVYQLQAEEFTRLEREINQVIYTVHEKIGEAEEQHAERKNSAKKNRSISGTLFRCVIPDSGKTRKKMSVSVGSLKRLLK